MATVKLLLKESVKHLGKVGDLVDVSPGYARNYLMPKDLAMEPTPANVKRVEERRKEVERQERERRDQQAVLIGQLAGVEVTLERRANEQGHLFGSVSATDIAKGLQAQGFNIQPDDVFLPGKLDRINTYQVRISFADDLTTEVKVWVAPDAQSKAAMDEAAKVAAAQPAPASNFERT
jgi:large subunit ribosomal protein L9